MRETREDMVATIEIEVLLNGNNELTLIFLSLRRRHLCVRRFA
jgi:hypothetical protein